MKITKNRSSIIRLILAFAWIVLALQLNRIANENTSSIIQIQRIPRNGVFWILSLLPVFIQWQISSRIQLRYLVLPIVPFLSMHSESIHQASFVVSVYLFLEYWLWIKINSRGDYWPSTFDPSLYNTVETYETKIRAGFNNHKLQINYALLVIMTYSISMILYWTPNTIFNCSEFDILIVIGIISTQCGCIYSRTNELIEAESSRLLKAYTEKKIL